MATMASKKRGEDPEEGVVAEMIAREAAAEEAAAKARKRPKVLAVEYPRGTRHEGDQLERVLAGLDKAFWPNVIVEYEDADEPNDILRIRPYRFCDPSPTITFAPDGTAKIF